MNGKSTLNSFITFLLIIGLVATQASAAVITVSSSGGENYSSIQEAIDNAQDGDTILVNPGVYQENIKVDKEVSIISNSASEGRIIRTYVLGAVPDDDVFYVNSSNVTIEGFYISGGPSGEDMYEVGIYLDGVENCSLVNNALILNSVGIALSESHRNVLENNLVSLGRQGIILDSSEENILSENIVLTNDQGILLNSSANNTLINNTAGSNTVGVFLGMSDMNELTENRISKNEYGVLVQMAELNSLVNNSLYLNNLGVYFNESSNNTIYQNKFLNFVNAVDEGTNIWNSSSEGNSWSDYTGEDANGDGIGDTPYVINQTTGSIDYMPLVTETSDNNSENTNE